MPEGSCKKSLITYSYFQTERAEYNLDFFSKKAILESEDLDYIIVVNGNHYNDDRLFSDLRRYSNVTILERENVGYDFGAHKHALDSVSGKEYDYYFFLNCGVVGPILPHHFPKDIHWTELFIPKITDDVKLVGTSIVCLPESDAGGLGPKVEGFFFMTDSVGLKLLLDEETIFTSSPSKYSTIVDGEYGLSRCILGHNYNIDCMLHRYQGVDWRDKKNWLMNNQEHPSRHNSFYGRSIDPYEVVFHKWYWGGDNENTVNLEMIKEYISHA